MKWTTTTLTLLISVALVSAHGGGLDADGGHTNRKTGEYHYHRKPAEKPVNTKATKAKHTVNSESGIRHNSSCRYFDCYNCYPAGANEGLRACKICGG